jgi:hypothetical protein
MTARKAKPIAQVVECATSEESEENSSTRGVPVELILMHASFALGVKHRRNGVPPQFDRAESRGLNGHDQWIYERGRLFASLAPTNMPLWIGKELNPKAVRLYLAARERGYII